MVIMILQSRGDADTSIVSTVLEFACVGENACLIAADADLLIMLNYMWNDMMRQTKIKVRVLVNTKSWSEISGRLQVL